MASERHHLALFSLHFAHPASQETNSRRHTRSHPRLVRLGEAVLRDYSEGAGTHRYEGPVGA